jgi:hypothetical protein
VGAVPNNRLDGDMTFEFGAGSPLQIGGAAAAIGATAIRTGGGRQACSGCRHLAIRTKSDGLLSRYDGCRISFSIDLRPGAGTGVDLTVVDTRAVQDSRTCDQQ